MNRGVPDPFKVSYAIMYIVLYLLLFLTNVTDMTFWAMVLLVWVTNQNMDFQTEVRERNYNGVRFLVEALKTFLTTSYA